MAKPQPSNPHHFLYTFSFPDGTEKKFTITLDGDTLELIREKDTSPPPWTKLKFHQCDNCPLGDEEEYCPIAVNLSSLVETFKKSVSYESTLMKVQTERRLCKSRQIGLTANQVVVLFACENTERVNTSRQIGIRFLPPRQMASESGPLGEVYPSLGSYW